ncbi:MAG: ornithine cyclodeaminase family protein [Firmicutes bacterium]|nr:ornithine cyclodeaminase family protein [Bacillota bacterium]MBQ3964090.1 ornithine cyclodeaminase family protein [Bacillota bacterium]
MKKAQLKFLSQEDILSLQIPYMDVIDVVERVMSEFAKGTCQLPVKIHVNTRPDTYINAMPAYVGGDHDVTGLKWVAGYPDNRKKGMPVTCGIMVMNDSETGLVKAFLDARWITAIRTAAVAAVTAKYCKVKDTHAMTIIGAGEQGKWNARLFKLVIPELKKIYIGDIYEPAIEAYLKKMQPLMPDVEIIPFYSDEERQAAIDESQILLTATQRGDKPIIYSEMLHKGMLGIPLESTAWEGKTYTRFADRFVCDDWNLVQTYLRDGKYTDGVPDEYCLLGDIINGKVPGRANEEEFVITSSHGIALSDVAVADIVLKKAEEKGVGQILTLMEEEDILR